MRRALIDPQLGAIPPGISTWRHHDAASCPSSRNRPWLPWTTSCTETPSLAEPDAELGYLVAPSAGNRLIPNRYMVTVKRDAFDVAQVAAVVRGQHGGNVRQVWRHALNGFVIDGISHDAALAIAGRNDIIMVEQDSYTTIAVDSQYTGANSALWGLDRVDQRGSTGDDYYHYQFDASNVHVYILDTGIDTHDDLDGRIGSGWGIDDDTDDCHGHGTAMASLVAGTIHGIAKDATVHPVRVSEDCSRTWPTSNTVSGVDWVAENHSSPAVLNMSVSTDGGSSTLDNAVSSAIGDGVIVVAGAGNDNDNACEDSPGRVSAVITVGASTASSERWVSSGSEGSNYGSCVDIFAPGDGIEHATLGNSTAVSPGTSVATAFVSGAAALLNSQEYYASQAFIQLALTSSATPDSLSSLGSGSPNKLLYAPHTYSYMDGPVSITTAGNNTWTAKRWGGLASYSYLWEISFDGSYYSTVGTSQSYVRYVDDCENFFLRVTIDSGDEVKAHTKYVQPHVEPCPM